MFQSRLPFYQFLHISCHPSHFWKHCKPIYLDTFILILNVSFTRYILFQTFPAAPVYFTSSTAQGGGGSFKNRKPIGEVGCCEAGMAKRIHWWTERCLRSPLFLSLSLTIYLPTSLSSMYLSIYLSIYLSLSPFHLITYLPIYLSIYLFVCLSICLPVYLWCSVIQSNVV